MNVDLDDPWALQTAAFVSCEFFFGLNIFQAIECFLTDADLPASALAIQLWEYVHLFVDEVEYIWRFVLWCTSFQSVN